MFRQLAEGLLKKSGISDYQLGTSKVFLRAGQMALLDKQRTDTLNASAIRLQRYARSYLARQHFKKAKQAVIRMQVRSSKLLVKGSGCCCCCSYTVPPASCSRVLPNRTPPLLLLLLLVTRRVAGSAGE